MPKRSIVDIADLYPEIVEQIAAIHKAGGHELTVDEERDFMERRARGMAAGTIQRLPESILIVRRGQYVYRELGKAGADLYMPPWAWRDAVAERDRLAELSKRQRQPRLAAARSGHAIALQARIIELSEADTARGRYKRIARKAGCSVRQVERVLARNPPRQK